MKEYKKLVRDNIPHIIERDGEKPISRILDSGEFKKALQEKLVEEAIEARDAVSASDLTKEIGDILEVIDSLVEVFDLKKEEIENIKKERKEKRGGFAGRIFLERTE